MKKQSLKVKRSKSLKVKKRVITKARNCENTKTINHSSTLIGTNQKNRRQKIYHEIMKIGKWSLVSGSWILVTCYLSLFTANFWLNAHSSRMSVFAQLGSRQSFSVMYSGVGGYYRGGGRGQVSLPGERREEKIELNQTLSVH